MGGLVLNLSIHNVLELNLDRSSLTVIGPVIALFRKQKMSNQNKMSAIYELKKDQTCFSFSCPASIVQDPGVPSESKFGLPENVWVVLLDVSEIQRNLLN